MVSSFSDRDLQLCEIMQDYRTLPFSINKITGFKQKPHLYKMKNLRYKNLISKRINPNKLIRERILLLLLLLFERD